jgi:hypothetical protein
MTSSNATTCTGSSGRKESRQIEKLQAKFGRVKRAQNSRQTGVEIRKVENEVENGTDVLVGQDEKLNEINGWGTWIRTKINGVRVGHLTLILHVFLKSTA